MSKSNTIDNFDKCYRKFQVLEAKRRCEREDAFKENLQRMADFLDELEKTRHIEILSSEVFDDKLKIIFSDPNCGKYAFQLSTTKIADEFGFSVYYMFGTVYFDKNTENAFDKYKEYIDNVPKEFWENN